MLEKFLVSGYTKRASRGVYSVLLDTEAERLMRLHELAQVAGPTYLTVDAARHLYCVAADGAGNGGMAAFQLTADGETQALGAALSPGSSDCYVAADEARGLVYGANYHMGEVRVYRRQADGSLVLADSVKHEDAHGPRPEQTGALVHFTGLTPDGRLAVCDLGNDRVYTYDVAADGHLSEIARYQSAAGSGDRHLAFAADGRTAYLSCELDSTVEVLAYDEGVFSLVAKHATIPADYHEHNGVAAIRLSADGRYLYVSNRGHDSLAIFSVSADGRDIALIERVATGGHFPRDFNFNATEDYVIVAHQESDNLVLFKRDKASGLLSRLHDNFYAPEMTCVYPLPQ